MKVVVCLDNDGHFQAARLDDKETSLEVLKSVDDGQWFDDKKDDNEFPEDYSKLSDEDWDSLMQDFVQRGTFEIVEF